MESITIDDTFLTGSEGVTLFIDDKTLAGTPAPVAASTVVKARSPRDNGGSFLNSKSVIITEVDSDGSGSDRSSLGLLPSNCLLEIENDLLREGSICLIKDAASADTRALASSSSVNSSKKNQLMDSQSSREYTCDTNEFLTTVKKCPQDAGRYKPQALFQSVQEEDESRLNSSSPTQRDPQVQHGNNWDNTEAQKNADSGMGQGTFTGSQTDSRKQSSEVWGGSETQKSGDSGVGQVTFAGSQVSAVIGAVFSGLGIPLRRSAGRANFPVEEFNLPHTEDDDDADQSVYQVCLLLCILLDVNLYSPYGLHSPHCEGSRKNRLNCCLVVNAMV
ncbi:unnamed protein product [Candidula unifasciata]|uniref:Uncharacterized protein n=1 Tax=Candidula unifasciata TaxID=100452 RepID=A0A8S3YWX4_9EUPU|nr:unnamed protein product [Candidula unifasciata]